MSIPQAAETGPEFSRPIRRDAARNHRAVLDAARSLFAERGIGVGFDEIARIAGVGVGTVYRHFPSRDLLLIALLEDRFAAVAALAQRAIESDDAWAGLEQFIASAVEMFSEDRGFREIAFDPNSGYPGLVEQADRLAILLHQVAGRAHQEGVLRADCQPEDLGRIIAMLSRLSAPSVVGDTVMDEEATARCTSFVLAGIRAARTPVETTRRYDAHD